MPAGDVGKSEKSFSEVDQSDGKKSVKSGIRKLELEIRDLLKAVLTKTNCCRIY